MVLGIGVDIVEIERVRALLERHGDRFVDRVLSPGEKAYCSRRADPAPSIASRFAAKEAVLKALGIGWSGGVRWQDVEVVRGEVGPPRVELHGRAARVAENLGVRSTHITLSHDGGAAVAVAVLEGER